MSSPRSIGQAIVAALSPRTKAATSMVPTSGTGGWWPVIREPFAGAWQRDLDLNPVTASSFYADFCCRTLIARDIAKLPIRLKQRDRDGIWTETTSAAFSPVLRRPNHFQNRNQFVERWLLSKLARGNSYVLKQRDNRRVVVAMHVLHPDRVRPLVASDGSVFYECNVDELNDLPSQVIVPSSEVIHDRMNTIDHPLVGVAPIYAAMLAATQGVAIQSQAIRLFRNAATPNGILTAPGHVDDDTAERVKTAWETKFGGENIGRVAVLGDNLKFEKLSLTAVEGQLIEQLRWTSEVICACYHVPAFLIGAAPEPATGSAQERTLRYYTQCLQSLIEDMESCLDEGLGLGEQYDLGVEIDVGNLLRMDGLAQAEVVTKLAGGAVLTPDEGRAVLDKKPIAGGNALYRQQQEYSLEALAKRDAKDDPFAKADPAPAPAKAAPTGPAIGPAASGTTSKGEIEVGGKPGDGASDVARPRLPTLIVQVRGDLDDALCDRVLREIESAAGPIDVHIDSDGGKLSTAMSICAAVEAHAHVVTTITSKAHSGAALIAMCGDRRLIQPDGEIMIHEARRIGGGPSPEDAQEMIARAVSDYSAGWSLGIVRAWMEEASPFTAEQAQRAGFVDAVIDPEQPTAWLDDPPKRRPSEWLRHFRETEEKVTQWKQDGSIT